ncbi:MAG: MFS transporter, partial [Tannerella sp.]|nr:MFS transporter [Tannerella sp.]
FATSVYFLFRTLGCLSGSFILSKFPHRTVFLLSVLCILVGVLGLCFLHLRWPIYACIGLVGLGNSNIFSIVVAQALLHLPEKKNEVSGLMIMGLIGGALFPLAMGVLSDALHSQVGALAVIFVGTLYLLTFVRRVGA